MPASSSPAALIFCSSPGGIGSTMSVVVIESVDMPLSLPTDSGGRWQESDTTLPAADLGIRVGFFVACAEKPTRITGRLVGHGWGG